MFSFTRLFVICLLNYPLWLLPSSEAETSAPHSNPILSIEDKHCTAEQSRHSDCVEQLIDDQGIDELEQMHMDQVLKYFLDIVYENSFCKCQGNNGCTRGCRLVSYLSQGEHPTIRKCEGRKPLRKSFLNCAMHVTGAMMAVIHDFLADHCQSTTERALWAATSYTQCENNFIKNANSYNIHICRHGFQFHSALCLLNLDRQSAHLYNSIRDKGVRSNCKRWDQYNQSLLAVNVSFDNGRTAVTPLFRRLPSERNEEFRSDPSQIPTGAIIVTRSYARHKDAKHGHVEIKTDRNECGEDKTQTCFCSDYCRERLRYAEPILAVFEWNPEFIRYVSIGWHVDTEVLESLDIQTL